MPAPQSAIAQRSEDLERFEFMMGAERGRLAVTLDMLTDALILIGSTESTARLRAILQSLRLTSKRCWPRWRAKELIQSVMEQLRLKNENAAEH